MEKQITIAVTGSQGQLGKSLHELESDYPQFRFVFLSRSDMPIHHFELVRQFFEGIKPDYVINAAAYTAVDRAEQEKELAFQVNAEAVGVMAAWCQAHGAKFLQVSTDYVFDGQGSRPYLETDPTGPKSVYGASKLAGEQQAMQFNPDCIIVRTAWVYSPYGKNFFRTMVSLLHEKPGVRVVQDQIGTPTYARDLAKALLDIIASGKWKPGIYNYTNSGQASWHEFAQEIQRQIGSRCVIEGIPSSEYPTPATRPAYSVLDKQKIVDGFGVSVPDWKISLADCVSRAAV
jgi:dTDP-4-dehydrorhamnose reductase